MYINYFQPEFHKRIGNSNNNFNAMLPPKDSDLVDNTIKDPYIFDFITLKEEYKERELEEALIIKIRNVLLELGNKTIKKECDSPSIGLLLCREKNRVTVDWSLKSTNVPIGVSAYKLKEQLPKELIDKLPTEEEINLYLNVGEGGNNE